MKDKNIVIARLENLGFTNYEARVFLELMKGHNMTAAEIAEGAGVPRTSVYDILKLFTERGYCNEIQTTTKLRYEIIEPEIIENKLKNDFFRKYESSISDLKDSFETLKPLYQAFEKKEDIVEVELIKGYNKMRHVKFMQLLKESNQEMLLMNRLEGYVSAELDEITADFYKRGGKVYSIYEASTNFKFNVNGKWEKVTNEDLIKLCEEFEKNGENIKMADSVPQNIAIFDREVVFINLINGKVRTDIIVRNNNFARSMKELFDLHWEKSDNLNEYKQKTTN